MTTYNPPNELLPIFDPINFLNPTATSTSQSATTFLEYPLAQGQENFGAFGFQTTGQADMGFATFSSIPTCPTATLGTNNTTMATTAFVIANQGGAPGDATLAGTQTFTGLNTFTQQIVVDTTTISSGAGTGTWNNAVGTNALQVNTTGNSNNAFGYNALLSNTQGPANNAFGNDCLQSNTLGMYNQGMGQSALNNNTTGDYNNAIGYECLQYNVLGNNNTAIGIHAGNQVGIANGFQNNNLCTFLGDSAGTAGAGSGGLTQSTAIGANASCSASNQIVLGTATETTFIPGNLTLTNALTLPNNSTATTQTAGTNNTTVATTAFVLANLGPAGDATLAGTQTFTGQNTFQQSAYNNYSFQMTNSLAGSIATQFISNLGVGAGNPTTQTNDAGILFGTVSNGASALNIFPTSTNASGLRLSTTGAINGFQATCTGAVVVKGAGTTNNTVLNQNGIYYQNPQNTNIASSTLQVYTPGAIAGWAFQDLFSPAFTSGNPATPIIYQKYVGSATGTGASSSLIVSGTTIDFITGTNATYFVPVALPTGSTAITQAVGNNTTQIATTAFVLANASPLAPTIYTTSQTWTCPTTGNYQFLVIGQGGACGNLTSFVSGGVIYNSTGGAGGGGGAVQWSSYCVAGTQYIYTNGGSVQPSTIKIQLYSGATQITAYSVNPGGTGGTSTNLTPAPGGQGGNFQITNGFPNSGCCTGFQGGAGQVQATISPPLYVGGNYLAFSGPGSAIGYGEGQSVSGTPPGSSAFIIKQL